MPMVTTLRVDDDVKARFDGLLSTARSHGLRLSQSELVGRLLRLATGHEDELWSDGSWSPPAWDTLERVLEGLPDAGPATDTGRESFA